MSKTRVLGYFGSNRWGKNIEARSGRHNRWLWLCGEAHQAYPRKGWIRKRKKSTARRAPTNASGWTREHAHAQALSTVVAPLSRGSTGHEQPQRKDWQFFLPTGGNCSSALVIVAHNTGSQQAALTLGVSKQRCGAAAQHFPKAGQHTHGTNLEPPTPESLNKRLSKSVYSFRP